MGSLLRITPQSYFEYGRNIQLVKAAMASMTKNIETGSLKTRWNACHATSNMLKNAAFPIGDGYPWTEAVYGALAQAVRQCRNYKVKINACLALATPVARDKYGRQFETVLQAILSAWEACHKEEDGEFQEYRYREQLKDQVREKQCRLWHTTVWGIGISHGLGQRYVRHYITSKTSSSLKYLSRGVVQ